MGACCGGTKNIQYKHDGKVRIINTKQCVTLDRFGQGAIARRQTQILKIKLAKDIAGKYPRRAWRIYDTYFEFHRLEETQLGREGDC